MTSTPELTTRDVLQQVDRRLSLIEDDLRGLDAKLGTKFGVLDAKIDALDAKLDAKLDTKFGVLDAKIDALDAKFDAKLDAKIGALDAKIDKKVEGLDAKLDSRFNLVIGLILASWFSMMGAFLLK